jgi:hypothetical protein
VEEAESAEADAREEAFRETLHQVAVDALSLGASAAVATADGRAEAGAAPGAAALRDGIATLARNAGAMAPVLGDAGRGLSRQIGQALEASEEVLRAGRQGRSPVPWLEQTRARLNDVALAALEAAARGSGQADDALSDEAQSLADALQELTEQQEALNRDASGGADAGAGTEPVPGTEGPGQELATRQEAVAAGLGELSRMPGGDRVPGNLEELAREAEALARELAGVTTDERIAAETLDRQSRLLDRMLDAGRSLERDGPTEERRGSPGAVFPDRPFVPALPAGLLREAAIPLPSESALAELSPGERRLVLEYFERLRREGGR